MQSLSAHIFVFFILLHDIKKVSLKTFSAVLKRCLLAEKMAASCEMQTRIALFGPLCRNLYWTDWNREAPKIETSYVDGSNRRILVNDNLGLPNGLTFDPFSKQICWADAGTLM